MARNNELAEQTKRLKIATNLREVAAKLIETVELIEVLKPYEEPYDGPSNRSDLNWFEAINEEPIDDGLFDWAALQRLRR